mmetsp:Transcript_24519/g.70441  ORF Transcript_24519/g.70441 Transcript_24519/m.70441 type:complete len:207 (-) Transcript_24519:1286-1906(-)
MPRCVVTASRCLAALPCRWPAPPSRRRLPSRSRLRARRWPKVLPRLRATSRPVTLPLLRRPRLAREAKPLKLPTARQRRRRERPPGPRRWSTTTSETTRRTPRCRSRGRRTWRVQTAARMALLGPTGQGSTLRPGGAALGPWRARASPSRPSRARQSWQRCGRSCSPRWRRTSRACGSSAGRVRTLRRSGRSCRKRGTCCSRGRSS